MRLVPLGFLLALLPSLIACGGDDGPPSGAGTVVGRVVAPHAGGLDVVGGAVVFHPSGARAVAADDGSFVLDEVPAGTTTLRIEGPRADDADHALIYAPGFVTVDVMADAEVAVEAAILLGCERTFDATAAAVLPLRGCGANRGAIELPAGAIAGGGAPFAGRVRAEIAVVDPAAAALQSLALTPPASDDPLELAAGISVRLHDAATGAPLQLAAGQRARLRLPVAASIGPELQVAWRDDDGATTPQPALVATLGQDGSGPHVAIEVEHFSSYVVVYPGDWGATRAELVVRGWIGEARSCSTGCVISSTSGQHVNPTCAGTVCVNDSTAVEVWWNDHHRHGTTGIPINVPADTVVSVRLRHTNTLARSLFGTPIYDSGWFPVRTPAAGQRADVGPVAVPTVPEGCATLSLPAGACQAPLRIFRGGELIQASYGDFCAPTGACVQLPAATEQPLTAETGNGRRVTLNGNPAWGQTCGGGACTMLGATTPTPPAIGMVFSARSRRNLSAAAPAVGNPGSEYAVDLDGATSAGAIDTYAWTVFAIEAGAEVPIWDSVGALSSATVGLDAGSYRVRLRGYGGRGQWDETSSPLTVGGDPDAPIATFVVSPATPAAGSSFSLDASASTAASPIVTWAWDLDGNGSFESTQTQPYHNYVFATPGPHPITLRVTDDQARTGQVTRVVNVGGTPGQVTVTVTRAGNTAGAYVIGTPTGISCSEGTSAVCSASFAPGTSVRLDAYVAGVPAQSAWGNVPGADGYQLFMSNLTMDRAVTATF